MLHNNLTFVALVKQVFLLQQRARKHLPPNEPVRRIRVRLLHNLQLDRIAVVKLEEQKLGGAQKCHELDEAPPEVHSVASRIIPQNRPYP